MRHSGWAGVIRQSRERRDISMAKRSAFGRKTRGRCRRSAPRFTALRGEVLEPRQLLAYVALQDTPLVVGYSGYANGTVGIAPSHGSLIVRPEGGFTYTPEVGYRGSD